MADAFLSLARFRWFAFRHSPLSQHHDPAMARPLLDAAAAEPEALLSRMGTTPQGLTAEEAAVRLRIVGPNLIAHDRRQSLFAELVGRARNPLNFLLLSLAAVSFSLGDRRAAAVIIPASGDPQMW
ncbi:MAG: cation-transporting P-type ATPase [Stellaceae bacterium]